MLDLGELRARIVIDKTQVEPGLRQVETRWKQHGQTLTAGSKKAGEDAGKAAGAGVAKELPGGLKAAEQKMQDAWKRAERDSGKGGEAAGRKFGGGFRDRLRSLRGDSTKAGEDSGAGFLRGATAKVRGGAKDLRSGFSRSLSALRADAENEGKKSSGAFSGAFKSGLAGVVAGAAGLVAFEGLGSFLAGAKQQASDLGETLNKSSAIFGDNQASIEQWANGSARAMGVSKAAALEQAAAFGDMFLQIGFTGSEATKQTKSIVQFAADLGSFSNLETEDVLDRISAALRGEYDSLQAVIPNINAARVEQEALTATNKKSAAALTAQEKATAVLAIVQKDGARAAGDFSKTSGSLANQQKILGAELENIQARVGQKIVPILAQGAQAFTGFLNEMQNGEGVGGGVAETLGDLADTALELGQTLAKDVLPPVAEVGKLLAGTLLGSAGQAKLALGAVVAILAARKAQGLADSIDLVGTKLQKAEGRVGSFGGKISGLGRGLGAVSSFLGGPWGIAIGIGVTALAGLVLEKEKARKASEDFYKSLTFEKGALDAASKAATAKKLADEDVLAAVTRAGIAENDYLSALTNGKGQRQAMIDQLSAIAREHTSTTMSGTATYRVTDKVGKAAQKAAESLRVEGDALDKAATGAKLQAAALGQSKQATKEVVPVSQQLKTAQDKLVTTQKELSDALQQAINKFTILKDGALDAESANVAYESALDSMTASVKANGSSLDRQTEKGRENRSVIVSSVQALNDKIKADYESTLKTKGSARAADEAAKSMRAGRRDIIKAAEAAGLNKDQVEKMIKQMLKTPKQLKTDVSAPGVDAAKNKVKSLKEVIDGLKDSKTGINFTTNAASLIKKYKLEGVGSVPFMSPTARGGFMGRLPGNTPLGLGDDMSLPVVGGGRQPVRGGEGVYVTEAMNDPRERQRMTEVNSAALRGESLDRFHGLADGGLVRRMLQVGAASLGQLPKAVGLGHGESQARIARRQADEIGDALGSRLASALKRAKAKEEAAGGGPVGKGGYAKALAWARRQEGHPYVFGTLWDCSGFVSAVHSIIKGEQPHRRYATPAFSGPKAAGFTRGKRSPFMVGVNPSPGRFGHMAATLNGVNIESAGGVGVRIGPEARGWNNPMFSWRGGLARGGMVGDLPFDLLDPRGERYNPWLSQLVRMSGMPGYAGGTRSAAPGFAWTAEKQAELVVNPQLRRYSGGERVVKGSDTRDVLSQLGRGRGDITVNAPSEKARDIVGELEFALARRDNGGVKF